MSNKAIKKDTENEKKKTGGKWKWAVAGVLAIILLGIGVAVGISISGNSEQTQEQSIAVNENGELIIPVSDISEDFEYIDYGEPQELLLWRDENDNFHTAFNTCQECFPKGNAHYTYENGILTCQSCGNQIDVSSMGEAMWGGCQPVAIPAEYREDTETEIRLPVSLLTYSKEMFQSWEDGDFSVTLENFQK